MLAASRCWPAAERRAKRVPRGGGGTLLIAVHDHEPERRRYDTDLPAARHVTLDQLGVRAPPLPLVVDRLLTLPAH